MPSAADALPLLGSASLLRCDGQLSCCAADVLEDVTANMEVELIKDDTRAPADSDVPAVEAAAETMPNGASNLVGSLPTAEGGTTVCLRNVSFAWAGRPTPGITSLHAASTHQAFYAVQEVERPNVRRGKRVQASKTPEAMTQKQVGLDYSGHKNSNSPSLCCDVSCWPFSSTWLRNSLTQHSYKCWYGKCMIQCLAIITVASPPKKSFAHSSARRAASHPSPFVAAFQQVSKLQNFIHKTACSSFNGKLDYQLFWLCSTSADTVGAAGKDPPRESSWWEAGLGH